MKRRRPSEPELTPLSRLTPEQRTERTRQQILAAYQQEVARQAAEEQLRKEGAAVIDICRLFPSKE